MQNTPQDVIRCDLVEAIEVTERAFAFEARPAWQFQAVNGFVGRKGPKDIQLARRIRGERA